MTDAALPSSPSLAVLIGAAFRDWLSHQARFWKLTVPAALLLALLPYAVLLGWLPQASPWVQSGVRAFIDVLVLYQWFKHALYDDWRVRRSLLLQQKKFPWRAFLSLGFVAFWALHFALSYGILSAWRDLVSGGMQAPLALQLAIVPLKELGLAAAFGSFMLFLPARVAHLGWTPATAFRRAAGIRLQLIAVTVLWALLSLVLLWSVDLLTVYVESRLALVQSSERAMLLVDFEGGLVGVAVDYLAYYLLAYIVARLFVAWTGWTPEPLPAAP
jgi:hypothetical protein